MSNPTTTRITDVQVWSVNIPMTEPFTISQGEMSVAKNLFVRVTLASGTRGYGEIAPFPELMGETQESCLAIAKDTMNELVDLDISDYHAISTQLERTLAHHPAVQCGFETAMVDGFCRERNLPLWALWGDASVREYETDMTIPIRTASETVKIVRNWYQLGFRTFKLKVGGKVSNDLECLDALDHAFNDIALIVDANQGYSVHEALRIAKKLEGLHATVKAFEQPVDRHNFEGMVEITAKTSVPIAADESVFTVEDARRVIREKASDIINLKITKSGLLPTIEIIALCRANNVPLMIGGMIETRLAMGCSFSLVLGLGGISILDLDTPLLMAKDPLQGDGYRYNGSRLIPWHTSGLGLVPREEP